MQISDKQPKYSEYPNNYFVFNRFILILASLYVPKVKNKLMYCLLKVYQIWNYTNYIYFPLTEFVSFWATSNNTYNFIKNINCAFTHVMGSAKGFLWIFKRNELQEIMDKLEGDEFHYKKCSGFNPGEILSKAKMRGLKISIFMFIVDNCTLSSAFMPPLYTALMSPSYREGPNGTMIFEQRLPYYSWIPFKYDTRSNYIKAVLYQYGPYISLAFSIESMDTLFINIMNFIGAHLEIIKGAFKTIRERSIDNINDYSLLKNDSYNTDSLDKEMMFQLRKTIKHLQMVLRLCEKMENLFKYLTLGQALTSLCVYCTSLFLMTATPFKNASFVAESFYSAAMIIQLVLYCWFGNEIMIKAQAIPNAIWETGWLGTAYEYNTCMLITIQRMQRPLFLTVGKFTPLTLNTFLNIIKASYSYFAVLRDM